MGPPRVESFTLVSDEPSTNLADKFVSGVARKIPYGVYHLRAYVAGFSSAEKDVYVYQRDTWAILGLWAGTIDFPYPRFRVSGRVRNTHAATSQIHLRLIGLFSEISLDTVADGSGKLDFEQVPQAAYILVTMRDGQVLNARPVQVPGSSFVNVDISR